MRWFVAPTVQPIYGKKIWVMEAEIHLQKNVCMCHSFPQFSCKRESKFISCTKHTYAPGGGLLIANQKLCFHSDCLSPLWKVFPVVTKTTIQQWQMNAAHSDMRWAGDLSINKLSTKPGGMWRTGGMTMRGLKGCENIFTYAPISCCIHLNNPSLAWYCYIYLHIISHFSL